MTRNLLRLLALALALVCATAIGSANVSLSTSSIVRAGALRTSSRPPRGAPRYVRVAGSHTSAVVSGPVGCTSNGPSSFVGVPGSGTDGMNYAGGSPGGPGYAGVVAGLGNEACDGYSIVSAGVYNTVGGDNNSIFSSIAGGEGNEIEGGGAFVGAGLQNNIGVAPPYAFPIDSAIVAGFANTVGSPSSFVGAGQGNSITANATENFGQSAFIGAGYNNAVAGNFSSIVAGQINSVAPDDSAIVGGTDNVVNAAATAAANGQSAFVGAGYGNTVSANFAGIVAGQSNVVSGSSSIIVGGISNTVSSIATNSAIVGGASNNAGGSYSLIGSGQSNAITANGSIGGPAGAAYTAIAGGVGNTIKSLVSSGAKYGFIGGGHGNTLNAFNGVIAGGEFNLASGDYATVPGGLYNYAGGVASFAAGSGSQALTNGSFVWSDDSTGATTLTSTAVNEFMARAAGGFYLYSSANLKSGVKLAPGSGSWSTLSDRAAKTGIEDVDDARILAKVASLPVSEWSYSAQGTGVRHLGPMAQDFRAAFRLGEDDKHISAVDEEGVALAAIKALQAELLEKDRKIDDLRRADDIRFARLEHFLESLKHNRER